VSEQLMHCTRSPHDRQATNDEKAAAIVQQHHLLACPQFSR
jgi:hypothetical protein